MVNLDINKAVASTYSSLDAYEIAPMNVDSIRDMKETRWTNANWSTYWGWFNQNPKVKNAIQMKAIWNTGKGWEAKGPSKRILDNITGTGKQTFKDILFSMDQTRRIGGDAYAEIIVKGNKTLSKGGEMINLKEIDPGSMTEIYGPGGRIKRYEQTKPGPVGKNGTRLKNVVLNKWSPDEIFHLTNQKIAGQIHGISDLEALRKVILAD